MGRRGAVGLAWGLLVDVAVGRFAVGFVAAAGALAARLSSRYNPAFANWAGLKSVTVEVDLVAALSKAVGCAGLPSIASAFAVTGAKSPGASGDIIWADARLLPRCCCAASPASGPRLRWSSPCACASDKGRLSSCHVVAW